MSALWAWLVVKLGEVGAKIVLVSLAFLLIVLVLGATKCVYDQNMNKAIDDGMKAANVRETTSIQSGSDAVSTVVNQQGLEQQIDQLGKEHADAIDKIPEAKKPVSSQSAAEWHRIMCQRQSYKNLPDCLTR